MLKGELAGTADVAFHVAFLALAVAAFATRRPRVHEAMAVVMVLLVAAYVSALFVNLH